MTLLTPEVIWPWPSDDPVINLNGFVLVEWKKRGDSDKFLAYDPAPWEEFGRSAQPHWLLKLGQDAVAERLTYLVSRALDLPCQHVFWGALGDSTVAAIRYVPTALPLRRCHRRPNGSPYVIVNRRRIPIVNEHDTVGHVALQILFSDLDGGETLIDGKTGIMFRVDGAAGHHWATSGINITFERLEEEDAAIRNFRSHYAALGTPWPGNDMARSVMRKEAERARRQRRTGPSAEDALRTISTLESITNDERPLMIYTLQTLANCADLPEQIAEAFRRAPSPAVRRLADDMACGLAASLNQLRQRLRSSGEGNLS
jgi:hypothetical protein